MIVCYVGERRTGKTTRLLRNFNKFSIVLDSATEHPQCSLVYKIKKIYPDMGLIRWRHLLSFLRNPENLLDNTPLLFDVSFFLERAHDVWFLAPVFLFLYYIHVHLILSALGKWILYSGRHFRIILDEIKLSPPTQRLLLALAAKKPDFDLMVAIHQEKHIHHLARGARIVYLQQKFE